jgi:hypothetical protein
VDSCERGGQRFVRVVVDFADEDAAGGPGWLRGAGEEDDLMGVGGRRDEVAEDGEAEACGCAGEGDCDHSRVWVGVGSKEMC